MAHVFLFFAVVGGSVMLFQLAMMLLGMAHDGVDGVGDTELGHLDGDADFSGQDPHHTDSTQGFKILSFKTVVAAITFFGLGGLLADSAQTPPLGSVAIAIGAGLASMLAVYKLYATVYGFQGEGTVRIDAAVGAYGTVYLTIPEQESGQGKVLINVQGRTMEYPAVTSGAKLATGTRIVVTRVITNNTVEVESAFDTPGEPASGNRRRNAS